MSKLPINRGGTDSDTALGARKKLGLEIGVNVQAYSAVTTALSGLSGSTGKIIRYGASNWAVSTATYPDTVTAGRVLVSTAPNVIGEDANLIWDSGNTRLGIGITPTVRFQIGGGNALLDNTFAWQIKDTAGVAQNLLQIDSSNNFIVRMNRTNGDAYFGLVNGSTSGIVNFQNRGANRMRISPLGLVGVGSGTPTALIDITTAGTATANTAPLKLAVGVSETTERSGLVQFSSSSSSGIQAVSGSRFTLTESDLAERYIVQSGSSAKTIAGAPYTNDGYVDAMINGTAVKLMTTA